MCPGGVGFQREKVYFKLLALPTLGSIVAGTLTGTLPALAFVLVNNNGPLSPFNNDPKQVQKEVLFGLAAAAFTMVFTAVFIALPAAVTLARVEASLLPTEVDSVVPIQRSPAGVAITTKGLAVMLLAEIRRTFDQSTRSRLVKFYIKYFSSLFFVAVMCVGTIVMQLYVMDPERFMTFVRSAKAALELAVMEQQ